MDNVIKFQFGFGDVPKDREWMEFWEVFVRSDTWRKTGFLGYCLDGRDSGFLEGKPGMTNFRLAKSYLEHLGFTASITPSGMYRFDATERLLTFIKSKLLPLNIDEQPPPHPHSAEVRAKVPSEDVGAPPWDTQAMLQSVEAELEGSSQATAAVSSYEDHKPIHQGGETVTETDVEQTS
ncbi:hypothetical protein NKR23_g12538 [Pleurostoma richardsiae]|uniref:Uncharacterized protein n=1 Tax=Pleurostoma richardsiae TaxID=41990 RepID=A0AA38RDS1_9PEZI|nr:hypothetical protein NKR23_g12538 [Pleurostoma richardsiae]